MKYLLGLVVLSSLLVGTAQADESFGCFATQDKDVCIRTSYQEVTPLDAFSTGYWDALIDRSGAALWDGAANFGTSVGQDLAKQVVGQLAERLGAPDFVLGMLGIGGGNPDISNRQVVAEIDRLLQEQTSVLIAEMDDNQVELLQDIKEVLGTNCTIETSDDYDTILRGINEWIGYDISLKSQPQHTNQMLNRLNDLASIEQTFSTNDAQSNYCYWGKHVEFFAWAMRLYGLDINSRIAYHNVVNDDPVLLQQNLTSDLRILAEQVEDMIWNLETSQTAGLLSGDEEVSGDKANAWWDDVVLDSHDFVKTINLDNAYNFFPDLNGSPSNVYDSLSDPYISEIFSELREATGLTTFIPSRGDLNELHLENEMGHYTINNIEYKITVYSLFTAESTIVSVGMHFPVKPKWRSMLVAEHFNGAEVEIFKSPVIAAGFQWFLNFEYADETQLNLLAPDFYSEEFNNFLVSTFQYHMDLEYTQRLQMAYAPYQTFLDDIWGLSNQERPSNKMDREYARTSGLVLLDIDGLSIKDELEIGTDPRNPDTDGDGFEDGFEFNNRDLGYDPLIFTDLDSQCTLSPSSVYTIWSQFMTRPPTWGQAVITGFEASMEDQEIQKVTVLELLNGQPRIPHQVNVQCQSGELVVLN